MKVKNLDLIKLSSISLIGLASAACGSNDQNLNNKYAPPPKNLPSKDKILQKNEQQSPAESENPYRDSGYCPACGMG